MLLICYRHHKGWILNVIRIIVYVVVCACTAMHFLHNEYLHSGLINTNEQNTNYMYIYVWYVSCRDTRTVM